MLESSKQSAEERQSKEKCEMEANLKKPTNLKNPLSWGFSTGASLGWRERPEELAERTGKIWAQVNVVLLWLDWRHSAWEFMGYCMIWWLFRQKILSSTRRILQRCSWWWRQSWRLDKWRSTEAWTKYRFLVRWLEVRKKTCEKLTHRHCSLNQKTGFNESQEPVRRAHLKKPLSSTGLAVAEAARRRTRLKIFVETEGDIVQTDLCWTAMRTPLRGLL